MPDGFDTETDFVNWVEDMINLEGNLLGHHEDAIAIPSGDEILVINIDGWVESTDRPHGMSLRQAGYRAIANAISDVIVKGAKPSGMIISASIPAEYKDSIKELILGFKEASHDFATPYFGGDMNSSKDLVIDVTVWGQTKQLIRRSGAQVGDNVYWLGPDLGCTAAALGILQQEWKGDKEKALKVMGRPELFPEFLELKEVTSATDSSDGLARSLYHISQQSEVSIHLESLDDIQTAGWIHDVGTNNELKQTDLFLFGGEELGVVFTSPRNPEEFDLTNTGEINKLKLLGTVKSGEGVFHNEELILNKGWDHFSIK